MNADLVNALFEIIGAGLTWANVYSVWKDKGYAGIYLPTVVLSLGGGVWSLFYYPSLNQWWSFAASIGLVIALLAWIVLMLWYGRKA